MYTALRSVSSPLLLIPAYGKIYATKADMMVAWLEGKDFKMYGSSTYTSIRDIDALRMGCSNITLHDPHSHIVITVD